jgi:microcystin-dependent protein
MGEVTGYTAAKMLEMANATVTTGAVNEGTGHLILTTAGGSTVDAGDVIGPTGPTGATGADGPDGVSPTGAVMMFAASTPPTGWEMCDGRALSRTTFSALYAAIGTVFGTGDGSTTFNVPNMQQKYARQDSGALGVTGGSDTHSHQIDGGTPQAAAEIAITSGTIINLFANQVSTASWEANETLDGSSPASSTVSENHGAKVVGQTQTASSDPPYLNLNFIIKT